MGRAGRVACIFTPYVLTIGALISLVFVALGSTNSGSSTLNNLYFFRADLSNLTAGSNSLGAQLLNIAGLSNDQLMQALQQAKQDLNLQDFYDIGLWGYCSGNKTSNNFVVTSCSKPQAAFWFNPVDVWKLNNTGVQNLLPSNLQTALDTYQNVSKWMFIAYAVAVIATAVELLVGITAIFSRLGSLITSLVSGVAAVFTIAASVTATVLFAILTGSFDSALKQYGITGSMGTNIYVATYFAVLFSLGGTLFWLFSSCCCSGRSPYHGDRRGRGRVMAEKAPYTYERVESPYVGGASHPATSYNHNSVPMQNFRQDAYEPFRQV